MLTDWWAFLENKWNFICSYPWTFIVFGSFCFLIGMGAYKYFVEIKIHRIPERESLQKEINQLKDNNQKEINQLKENYQKEIDQIREENDQLKIQLRKKTLAEEVEEFKTLGKANLGAVIAKNKKSDDTKE